MYLMCIMMCNTYFFGSHHHVVLACIIISLVIYIVLRNIYCVFIAFYSWNMYMFVIYNDIMRFKKIAIIYIESEPAVFPNVYIVILYLTCQIVKHIQVD